MIPNYASLEGKFLVAMPGMADKRFDKTVIYLCAHSEEGSMGFIINKPLPQPNPEDFFRQLNIILEGEEIDFSNTPLSLGLYNGGPVEPGRGFVLHSSDYEAETTIKVDENVRLTATLEILRKIATSVGPEKFFIALGYSGWSAGQLEEEISANGWLVTEADPEIVFGYKAEEKYDRVMAMMGINPSLLSADAGHA